VRESEREREEGVFLSFFVCFTFFSLSQRALFEREMLPLSTSLSSSSPRNKKNKSRGGGRRNLLSALIGFSVVFALGLFSSLFLYDIDDLEESHDGGKLSLMSKSSKSSSKSSGKEEEKDGERRKKKDAEDVPVAAAASGVGTLSSSFGGGGKLGTTTSFADSFSSSARTRGRGGAFPYRCVSHTHTHSHKIIFFSVLSSKYARARSVVTKD